MLDQIPHLPTTPAMAPKEESTDTDTISTLAAEKNGEEPPFEGIQSTTTLFTTKDELHDKDDSVTTIVEKDAFALVTPFEKVQRIKDPADNDLEKVHPSALAPLRTKEFSSFRKWFILFIVALQGFLGPLSSSIYVPAIYQVRKSLGASSTMINATISLYVFTLGVAPMMWAAMSERYGRRFIYIAATVIYVASTIGCALAVQIALFVPMRILQAVGASAAQAVGAGTITDLFLVHERGNAMGLFFLGPLIGPVVGPIAGGYVNEYLGWRYIFWALSGMGSLVLLLMLIFLPETSLPVLQRRAGMEVPPREHALTTFVRPFRFLTRPLVLLASTPYMLAYGFMYFIIATLPHQLDYRYHFSSSQIGLAYLANGVGNALGAVLSGKYADWALKQTAEPASETVLPKHRWLRSLLPALPPTLAARKSPEMRMSIMWLGVILLPLGELVYGWCVQYRVHVAAGLFGLFLLGLGVGIVQTPSNTYLVDTYQGYSASVIGASNFMRCTWAGCTPLFAPVLLRAIGNGWSMTILALCSLTSGLCIYLVEAFGEHWRAQDAEDLCRTN